MRIFISIDLPENVKREIVKIQKEILNLDFDGKLTEEENLHLTLKFLGEVSEEKVEQVKEKLFQIKFDKFEAEMNSIGFFDNFNIILWLHMTNCEKLQKKVDDALFGLFPPEKRFMSHLTIARIRKIKDKEKFVQAIRCMKIPKIKFTVDEFNLKESVLTKEEPKYKTLEKYDMN